MGFLAFLVPKLWPNVRKLIREIPTNPIGNSYKIWGRLAITLAIGQNQEAWHISSSIVVLTLFQIFICKQAKSSARPSI